MEWKENPAIDVSEYQKAIIEDRELADISA